MNLKKNTILITGGATGIGFALAKAFIDAGNHVIICGRRKSKLTEVKDLLSDVYVKPCDLSTAKGRIELYNWVITNFKKFNVLVNNAGIQREIDFRKGTDSLAGESEIEINLTAPIHLSALFIPHLMQRQESAIINISSGLGFIPLSMVPIYSATKAAIHSFSISLRHQLRDTSVKVFEIIPPTTNTELDKGARDRRGQKDKGISPEAVAFETMESLENEVYERPVGSAKSLWHGARTDPEKIFHLINH